MAPLQLEAGEIAQGDGGRADVRAQDLFLDGQGPVVGPGGGITIAGVHHGDREAVEEAGDARMLRAERQDGQRQRFLVEAARRGVVALRVGGPREVGHAPQRIGVQRAEFLGKPRARRAEGGPRRVELALVQECLAAVRQEPAL